MPRDPGSLVGTTIAGVYKVRRLIGAGSMGEVYAAEGENGQKAAIKVLHDKAAQDKDLVARFHREASIAAKVSSPHVATVLGAGKDLNGRPWIAFELLAGEGLDERLRREHYLSFAEVAPIVDDALQGLEAAHAAGVVHRDIKPANLFIETRKLTAKQIAADESGERTRILDFGVSKMRSSKRQKSEPSLTAFDATLGSFAYMPPEQVRGSARVDQRADLYALGAVAFRALTGRLPFDGQNAIALVALKLERDPPTLSSATGDGWPVAIERFLAKMMARDRAGRFASASDALVEWRQVSTQMGNAPVLKPRAPPASDEQTDVTTRTYTGATSVSKVRLV